MMFVKKPETGKKTKYARKLTHHNRPHIISKTIFFILFVALYRLHVYVLISVRNKNLIAHELAVAFSQLDDEIALQITIRFPFNRACYCEKLISSAAPSILFHRESARCSQTDTAPPSVRSHTSGVRFTHSRPSHRITADASNATDLAPFTFQSNR